MLETSVMSQTVHGLPDMSTCFPKRVHVFPDEFILDVTIIQHVSVGFTITVHGLSDEVILDFSRLSR
jgi:hypothetical protein